MLSVHLIPKGIRSPGTGRRQLGSCLVDTTSARARGALNS